MGSRRRVAAALLVAAAGATALFAIRAATQDQERGAETIVALTEFAAIAGEPGPADTGEPVGPDIASRSTGAPGDGSAPEFDAIVDSGVRDPADRIAPRTARIEVLEVLDHDPDAFTQGLEFAGGRLFESTGLVGQSTLRELDPATGQVLRSQAVPGVFAEGLTIEGDEIVQLTWTEEVAYRYDLDTFELETTLGYQGQGWGLCSDGARFVMSNGSSRLTFRDLESFETVGSVEVTFNGAPVPRLNELECVGATVWANIWLTPLIIEIDPASGRVLTVLDASELWPAEVTSDSQAVLNGIAFDPADDTFVLTGKRWPIAYRVRLDSS